MDTKPPNIATIAGDAEVEHAIATLVLAFGTDSGSALDVSRPIMSRWIGRKSRQLDRLSRLANLTARVCPHGWVPTRVISERP
jgi:hypothetical protein